MWTKSTGTNCIVWLLVGGVVLWSVACLGILATLGYT